jgi:tRNA-uridine 2-sulfurtransferase
MSKKQKVYLMLSGGVDSSVALYLLKQNPDYEIKAVFMKCFSIETLNNLKLPQELYACTWEEDALDASMVAFKLGVDFEIWDFCSQYQNYVISYMLQEYKNGRTPNPDVMCNSVVKFGAFYQKAVENGADFVATGHYAKKQDGLIAMADDQVKDQSYFLWKVDKQVLAKVLLPIGEIQSKQEVRTIASQQGLLTATKKDSQGLCFVGKTSLRDMLIAKYSLNPGPIVTTDLVNAACVLKINNKQKQEFEDNGYVTIGTHQSSILYTIGQREGLSIGGGPWYVKSIDHEHNRVYVVHQSNLIELNQNQISITGLNLFVSQSQLIGLSEQNKIVVVCRYNQTPVIANLIFKTSDLLEITFKQPINAIASGQSCVIYSTNGQMLGGGIIV